MSSGGLKRLAASTVLYAISNLFQRGLMLILLPLYARYFTKAEFGAMDLIYQAVLVLIILSSLGMPQGLPRGFNIAGATEADNRKLIGVLTAVLIPSLVIVSAFIFLFSDDLSALLFNGEGEVEWMTLSALFFASMVIQQYPLQILKARQSALEYSAWSILTFLIVTAGNVSLIAFYGMGLKGMLIANILGFGLVGLVIFVRSIAWMDFNFEFHRLRPLLQFGLPMLPALLGRKVLEASDRYMIPQYSSLDQLGEYVMGVKIANVIEVLVLVPFLFAWQPFFYSISNRADAREIFARVTFYFFVLSLFVFLAMFAVHREALHFLGGGAYHTSTFVIMCLVMSVLVNGVQYTISPGIHLSSRLVQEAVLMLVAAALKMLLNFLLIPHFLLDGAAFGTLVAYAFYFCSTFYLSQRLYAISYDLRRYFKVLVYFFAIFSLLVVFPGLLSGLLLVFVFFVLFAFFDLRPNEPAFRSVVRLSKLKLAGFKSFVDPTSIPVPGQLVAVVGPNGCGKSNVIDAVRWVLGESSARQLRGESMQDVIFNGSDQRKPVSRAAVELLFDNSLGALPASGRNTPKSRSSACSHARANRLLHQQHPVPAA
jgi:O-antigen/teichoic acid export membrane protein